MKQRVITALIALGIFLPILFVGDIWLRTLLAMLAIVAIYEFFQMKKMNIFSIEGALTLFATFIIFIFAETISSPATRN